MAKKEVFLNSDGVKELYRAIYGAEFSDWTDQKIEIKMLYSTTKRDYVPGFVMELKKASSDEHRYFIYSPLQNIAFVSEVSDGFKNYSDFTKEYEVEGGIQGAVCSTQCPLINIWGDLPTGQCLTKEKAMLAIKAFVVLGSIRKKIEFFQTEERKVLPGIVDNKKCWLMYTKNNNVFIVDEETSEVTLKSLGREGERVLCYRPRMIKCQ